MTPVFPLLLVALTGAIASTELETAREALDAGFPHVAVQKVKEADPKTGTPQAPTATNLLYAKALLLDGQHDEAIALLERLGEEVGVEGRFLLANALASKGDWNTALSAYSACAQDPQFAFAPEALFGKARMLRNAGEPADALGILEGMLTKASEPLNTLARIEAVEAALDAGDTPRAAALLAGIDPLHAIEPARVAFLRGRIALLSGDHAAALRELRGLKPVGPAMAVESTAIQAQALMSTNQADQARLLLEAFINTHPQIDGLKKLFALLDACNEASPGTSSTEWKRWAGMPGDTPAKKLAMFYLARFESRRGSPETALPMLEALATRPQDNPMAAEIMLELAATRILLGRPEEALGGIPAAEASPQGDFLRGLALARIGDYGSALGAFLMSARDPGLSADALFNASICEMLEHGRFGDSFKRLTLEHPASPSIEQARLQMAFHLAREGNPRTAQVLESLADSPDTAVAAAARLALAEWKYQQLDIAGAKAELLRVSTAAQPARQEALEVFLTDTGEPGAAEKTVDACRKFLAAYPDDSAAPAVWMKLGEVLFRKGDYASARVDLETLARKFPGSDYEESALFLAAQAASRIPVPTAPEDAILLFEEVASTNGVLAASARMEQASILAAQGKPLEANVVLDKILTGAPDRETRAGALIEKGKNFYRIGDKDPENYRLAIELWKQVAAEEQETTWRNQAMTRVGGAYEKLNEPGPAIAAYYEVIKPANTPLTEFFWFYKSGFAAARLLEMEKKWEESIRVYNLMAEIEGPRALEAKNRINKLRLEHFLWEDK